MDNVVRCKEHVNSLLPIETVNDVEEGADQQCQVMLDCIDNGPAKVYSGEHMGDVGHGRLTGSMLRDVDEEAVDDVEQEADQQVQVSLDCNKNESLEETTDTQFEVQDSNEGCVKKAQPKKISPSRQEDDCLKKSLKMKRYDDKVQLGTGSFSYTVKGYQRRFGSKGDRRVSEVYLDRRSFSCQEGGARRSFLARVA